MSVEEEKPGVIVVTGTAGSLGAAVAKAFIKDSRASGLPVVGVDISYEHDTLLVDPDMPNYCTTRLDVTRSEDVSRVFSQIRESFGPVRKMVHCAGGFRWAKLDEISDEDLDFLLQVNLKSSLLVVREVLGEMKREEQGHIVLISSRSTLSPGVGEAAYAATKAGLNAIVQSVAAEVTELPCTINAVLPSVLDTPPNRRDMPDADFSTWVKPDALARIIFGLTSDFGAPINGALIPVAGRT
jgi:NAD(P)-dependent dehydrogenase (short-subunit alcohol dehydrogenase family)